MSSLSACSACRGDEGWERMRFEVSDEAGALGDAATRVLANEAPTSVVRAGWPDGDHARVTDVWRRLAQVGVVGTLVPEAGDGLGLDENSLVPLLEAIGANGLPVPAVETIAVAAPLLAAVGSDRLADVLSGRIVVTAQLGGGDLVPFGQHAQLAVVREGDALRLYELDRLPLEPVVTVDGSRAMARWVGGHGGGTVLTEDPALIEASWQRGVLGCSAMLVGLARRMLEMTVGYVKQREQFGVSIGSFQAIKHALASALVAVEFARPMVLAAAWTQAAVSDPGDIDAITDASRQTSAAKALASDAAHLVARTAIQCHGAMGYTTEYDLHLFAKRAWALAPSWGDAAWHRAELADSLGV
jgi:alkylation response protein AidB-like acyl-CoA dehydrogenase